MGIRLARPDTALHSLTCLIPYPSFVYSHISFHHLLYSYIFLKVSLDKGKERKAVLENVDGNKQGEIVGLTRGDLGVVG